jgi:hypothetical protein
MGLPEICRPRSFSFLCEILKLAVEYLCYNTNVSTSGENLKSLARG